MRGQQNWSISFLDYTKLSLGFSNNNLLEWEAPATRLYESIQLEYVKVQG